MALMLIDWFKYYNTIDRIGLFQDDESKEIVAIKEENVGNKKQYRVLIRNYGFMTNEKKYFEN